MPPTLDGLPQELRDTIFAILPFQDLAALCRVSKAVRAAACPLLYRNVVLVLNKEQPTSHNAANLSRTLLENPTCAAQVKYFTVKARSGQTPAQGSREPCPPDLTPLRGDLRSRIEKMIDRAKVPEAATWKSVLCDEQNTLAQSAFIVTRLPNLERLNLDVALASFDETRFFNMLQHSMSRTVPTEHWSWLNNLTCVCMGEKHDRNTCECEDESDHDLSIRLTKLVLSLPKLREVELWGGFDLRDGSTPFMSPLAPLTAGHLTTLRMERTTFPPTTLDAILKENSQLKRLICAYDIPSSHVPLDLIRVKQALTNVSGSLTHFGLKCDVYAVEAVDVTTIGRIFSGNLGSFRHFTKMTELDISPMILFGQVNPDQSPHLGHILPPNIERLILNDNLWEYDIFYRWTADKFLSTLSGLLSDNVEDEFTWKRATRCLKEVVFDFRSGSYVAMRGWMGKHLDELRALCQSQGLYCTILLES